MHEHNKLFNQRVKNYNRFNAFRLGYDDLGKRTAGRAEQIDWTRTQIFSKGNDYKDYSFSKRN